MVTLISQDGGNFEVSVQNAQDCSVALKDILGEDNNDDEKRQDPILSVTLSVLKEVFKFCKEGTDANLYALLSKSPNLYALLDAADYLHVQMLIDAIEEYLKDVTLLQIENGRVILYKSQDVILFELSVETAQDCSVVLKDMLGEDDDGEVGGEVEGLLQVPITQSVLKDVFNYCEEGTDAIISESSNLYALLGAADYLDVQKLIDAIEEYLKDKISKIGAIPQVIRSFNIFVQDKVDCNDDTERCGFCTKRVVPYSDPTDAKQNEADKLLPYDPTQNRLQGPLNEIARHYFQGLEMCNAVARRMKLSKEKRVALDGELPGSAEPSALLEKGALPDFAKSTPDIALSIFGPNGVGAQEEKELIRAFIHTMWIPNSLKTKEDKMCALALRYVLTPRADSG
eukprot:g1949.t1